MGCDCAVCVSNDPKDKRLRASAMLEQNGKTIVIDCGPDFRQQMLRNNVAQVDAVVLTHDHQDHVAGMDDLRSYIFKQGKPMPVYAEQYVIDDLKQRYAYAFQDDPYPGAPRFEMIPIEPGPLTVEGVAMQALRGMHGQLPVLGFRMGSLVYFTDINAIPTSEFAHMNDLEHLIIDALHHRKHHSHFNLEEAVDMVSRLRPANAWFTHISHQMGLHQAVNTNLDSDMALGYDGQVFDLER